MKASDVVPSIFVSSCSVFVFHCSSNVVIATQQSDSTSCTRYNGILFSPRRCAAVLVTFISRDARLENKHVMKPQEH